MFTIRTQVKRPAAALVAAFKELATPVIADVMGRQGAMHAAIRPVYARACLCGPALPVRTYPSDNLMLHAALKFAEAGDVIVCDAGGYVDTGLWGEIMTVNAIRKGAAGLVIDGACRDINELEALNFPVFARGISARGGFKISGGTVNQPIACGGALVVPGDIVVADINGVVVVPQADAERVLALALEKLGQEQALLSRIRAGEDYYDIANLAAQLRALNVEFVR